MNIPIGIGVGLGSLIAGVVYDNYGEKAGLALKYLGTNTELVARAAQSADWSDSLARIPAIISIDRSQAFELACRHLGQSPEQGAETLRAAFRYDQGQIVNLGRRYLAQQEQYRDRADRIRRPEMFELVRAQINDHLPPDQHQQDAQIIDRMNALRLSPFL